MREYQLNTRLDFDENEQLTEQARHLNISRAALARILIADGLARFDRRNDALLDRIDTLINLVEKANVMAATAVAASLLPPGTGPLLDNAMVERIRKQIRSSLRLGRNINAGFDTGALDQEDDDVSAG